jgi:hypothetical protein
VVTEPFRFISRHHSRKANEERRREEHLVAILDSVLGRVERQHEKTMQGVTAMAAANASHSEALSKWFAMFQQDYGPGASHTVRSIDEFDSERKREMDRMVAAGYPMNQSPQEQLKWLLDSEMA